MESSPHSSKTMEKSQLGSQAFRLEHPTSKYILNVKSNFLYLVVPSTNTNHKVFTELFSKSDSPKALGSMSDYEQRTL